VQYTRVAAFFSCLLFAGCSFDPGGADVNDHDGAVADSAVADAPRAADAAPDANLPDASTTIDAALVDAALPDAAPPDATLPPDASMPLTCPTGYQHGMGQNADHCYRFVTPGKSWANAESDCENDNSGGGAKPHLIVFSNEAEFNDVRQALSTRQIWVGADDLASEGNFVNVTGGAFITTHFKTGEPNDFGDGPGGTAEDCILFEINFTPNLDPGFNDVGCSITHDFLCELDGASPL
jgi:hypothetical protein